MPVHPQAKAYLEQLEEEGGGPEYEKMTIAEVRALDDDFDGIQGERQDVTEVRDLIVPGPGGNIPVRVYDPAPEETKPLLVYLHGGGWVKGSIAVVDKPCRELANAGGCAVASVGYRLSPEVKFPGPAEDCYAAVRWLADHHGEVGGERRQLVVGGDSAGANLTAAVTLMARDRGGPHISQQLLIYPCLAPSRETSFASYEENAGGYLLTKARMDWFWDQYTSPEQGRQGYASPLLAEDLGSLPPAFVVTAEFDLLRDEGIAYAKRLEEAGVAVTHVNYPGAIHGFFWMNGVMDQGRELVAQLGELLRADAAHSKVIDPRSRRTTMSQERNVTDTGPSPSEVDVVIVGAGFSGLGMLARTRELGLTSHVFEAGDGVGGTWYWNRYPGAACDSLSQVYTFSFDSKLLEEWDWNNRYPAQAEVLAYLNFVADRLDLRRDISLETRVTAATVDQATGRWTVETDRGETISASYLIAAVGCLSAAQAPDIPGIEEFKGESYHTGHWPHEGVDLIGKRIGVIGTGSSGIQAIPEIAPEASHLYVFQRTPNFSIPARNRQFTDEEKQRLKANRVTLRESAKYSRTGNLFFPSERSPVEVDPEERLARLEADWTVGGSGFIFAGYSDVITDEDSNQIYSDFVRAKIREVIDDPEVAEKLMPHHPIGTKRTPLDTNYFETFNRPNVTLVDLRETPIEEITADGIRTSDQEYELDAIVYATGFDAMTGSLARIDIRTEEGERLADKWADGPETYLGLTTVGYPNLFIITGPQSPAVLSNMPVSIEQHIEWIGDCVEHMIENGFDRVEPTAEAEAAWSKKVDELAAETLMPKANSWYMGANTPGKPRRFGAYIGGVGEYRRLCSEIAADGYEGFEFTATGAELMHGAGGARLR
jgi:cation diffusion facilitator CzcD-associated flavoprotein CzcO/acetyl esterase/lipase